MSSSSCVSENYYRQRLNTEKGTPKQCWCGESSKIFTSRSATNPGILYYCCAKGYHKRKGDECISQGRCLRNVVVSGVGMAILCYYCFFV
ncbi:hypothetical protein N665_0658s0019 [Sinapis alba]|nr:hypothetical protein N665_0658s0019 [Sinapis alba]